MALLNHRQVEAFRSLMVSGSVTEAASIMGITQPAVSRLLRDLQATMRLTLFVRHGPRLIPTPDATALYKEVERSYVGLDRIRAAADNIRAGQSGMLRVAALPAIANGFLPRFAGAFMAERPDLGLSLHGVISPLVIDLVVGRQCDIGFAESNMAHPGLVSRAMPSPPRVAIVPGGHRLAGRAVIHPEDFAGEDFISLKHGSASRHLIDRIFEERGVERQLRIETHLSEIMCGLVSSGHGVAICDPFTAEEFRGRNVVAKPFVPRTPFEFSVMHAPELPLSITARHFIDAFSAHIEASTHLHASASPPTV